MNPFALDDALNTRARLGLPDAEDAPAPHGSTTSFSYWPRAVSQRQIRIRYLPKPSGESGASSSSHIRRPLHKLGTPGSPVHERLCVARRTDAGKKFPTADLTMV